MESPISSDQLWVLWIPLLWIVWIVLGNSRPQKSKFTNLPGAQPQQNCSRQLVFVTGEITLACDLRWQRTTCTVEIRIRPTAQNIEIKVYILWRTSCELGSAVSNHNKNISSAAVSVDTIQMACMNTKTSSSISSLIVFRRTDAHIVDKM